MIGGIDLHRTIGAIAVFSSSISGDVDITCCMCVHIQEKCHQYWPSERSARYQYFVVDPLAEYNMPHYVLREFKVTDARVGQPRYRPRHEQE